MKSPIFQRNIIDKLDFLIFQEETEIPNSNKIVNSVET